MALKVEHEDSVCLVLGVLGSGTVVIPASVGVAMVLCHSPDAAHGV